VQAVPHFVILEIMISLMHQFTDVSFISLYPDPCSAKEELLFTVAFEMDPWTFREQ